MKLKDKIIISAIFLGVFAYLIFLVKSILTPFIVSLIIAYFLNPLVDKLHDKYKFSRLSATSLIVGLFIAFIAAIFSFLMPIICEQFGALINEIPHYIEIIINDFYPQIVQSLHKAGIEVDYNLTHLLQNEELTKNALTFSQNIFQNALMSSLSIINIFSLIFISPILIFYLLKDWDIFIKKLNSYLPRKIAVATKKIALEIDKTLSGYLRGQFNVCFILALIYSILLTLAGLNFGFLIGFMTGLFSFIPFVGMLIGTLVAAIVAFLQWGFDITNLSTIAAIFVFGQIVESNFLTPKLIGSKIGLHPVWLIFGLFVFGVLFGFVGVLLAVPLTAIFGVIIKYFALEYKKKFT